MPAEGGKDSLICDGGYYARRVGLDLGEFNVQTEDGFIIALWHTYNPKDHTAASPPRRAQDEPVVFPKDYLAASSATLCQQQPPGKQKYPVLLVHGLLESAGAYYTNDDDSLAFYLAKFGYDVWLGNNRRGSHPRHQIPSYEDPRM